MTADGDVPDGRPADPQTETRDEAAPSALMGRRQVLAGAAALAWEALEAQAHAAVPSRRPSGAAAAAPARPGRLQRALDVRLRAARFQCDGPQARHAANGDEEGVPGRIACFSKGLPHDLLGQVDAGAYSLLLSALRSGRDEDFERIPVSGRVKLSNPQSAFAFNLIGPDPSQMPIVAPPRFASAEQAGEMAELYWHALARDIPFSEYESHPLTREAAEDLSRLSEFRGPKEAGRVTSSTLFRAPGAGDRVGPYISQFLWKDVPFTPMRFGQKIRTAVAGRDYLTDLESWLSCQNGDVAGPDRFEAEPRYVRNGRDLGEHVHRDFSYQAPLAAGLILLKSGALPDPGNPYKHSRTQSGFTTFGAPYLLHLLATVTQAALTACWYEKWMVHRRIRPEEFGGRVEHHLKQRASYPIHGDLLASRGLQRLLERQSRALLPLAYPEGCPTHPSYPAGHAVIAGAGVTVLKAFFDESFVIPEPVEAAPDGLSLRRYQGPPLTVGGELDKLASNVSIGRNFAGLHWRSDAVEGMRLGEAVAIRCLQELRLTGNEIFEGFDLHMFDGRRITV
jgi:hypothetical protein